MHRWDERIEALPAIMRDKLSLEAHLQRVDEVIFETSKVSDLSLALKEGVRFSVELHKFRPVSSPAPATNAGARAGREPGAKSQ